MYRTILFNKGPLVLVEIQDKNHGLEADEKNLK